LGAFECLRNMEQKKVMEVGGQVDETSVTLAIYGEELDPTAITKVLGCEPTSSHTKGTVRGPRGRPARAGAWLLEVRGISPKSPEELTRELISKLPKDEIIWSKISQDFDIQLRYAFHLESWNRGLDLSNEVLTTIALLGASIVFDVYCYSKTRDTQH